MKAILMGLGASLVLAAASAQAQDANGYWQGKFPDSLQVVLHLDQAAQGSWEGKIMVPAQEAEAKLDDLVVTREAISFRINEFGAGYSSRWNQASQSWVGSWTQGGDATPLTLERTDASVLVPRRPQMQAIAAGALPYSTIEVTFENAEANAVLAGTLTVPQGKGPHPAVILVHGSGALDRDATNTQHKPFLVLADHLARQGIAVLRYDKRGVGKSTGNRRNATTFDLADDAAAGIAMLRTRADIDKNRIGVIGHSEGGMIAPILTARDPHIAFAVLLAAPALRGDALLLKQIERMGRAAGAPEQAIQKDLALHRALFDVIVAEPDLDKARARLLEVGEQAKRDGLAPAAIVDRRVRQFSTPWTHAAVRHDPAPALQGTRQPVLALNGTLDTQVPADLNLPAIRAALPANPRTVVKEMPALNHGFQTAKTGASIEYYAIEETFAPDALTLVSDWIRNTVK